MDSKIVMCNSMRMFGVNYPSQDIVFVYTWRSNYILCPINAENQPIPKGWGFRAFAGRYMGRNGVWFSSSEKVQYCAQT